MLSTTITQMNLNYLNGISRQQICLVQNTEPRCLSDDNYSRFVDIVNFRSAIMIPFSARYAIIIVNMNQNSLHIVTSQIALN